MKKLLAFLSFILVLTALAAPGNRTVRLGWTASSEPEVYGYGVYFGIVNSGITNTSFSPTNTVTLANLPNGQYWFAVTAKGTNSIESDFSNIVFASIPRNPSNLVIQ